MVIQNTLNLSLNPNIVCIELIEVNLMACSWKSYTLHEILHSVIPRVIDVLQNAPVLQLLSEVCMLPFDIVATCQIPCLSEFGTVTMCRQGLACTDKFLASLTEGVVHCAYQVVTWSSFSVTW